MREIHAACLASSAHDVSEGGLAVTLAECCTAEVGAKIELDSALDPVFLLFHEAPSRIVICTTAPDSVAEICAKHDVGLSAVGVTAKSILEIQSGDRRLVHVASTDLDVPGIERFLQ